MVEEFAGKKLQLAWLYPEYLNLYGDRGNVLALRQRAAWRGIELAITKLSIGDDLLWQDYDLLFIGGGQDAEQAGLYEDLITRKKAALCAYIEDGRVLLAICGGYQLLGNYYKDARGKYLEGIGALPIYTEAADKRLIGDLKFTATSLPLAAADQVMYGFENHSGLTYLEKNSRAPLNAARPFGNVVSGYGNNGKDGTEGCMYKNTFGTYCHGSFLPKNPAFADYLLETALRKKYKLAASWRLPQPEEPLLTALRADLDKLTEQRR